MFIHNDRRKQAADASDSEARSPLVSMSSTMCTVRVGGVKACIGMLVTFPLPSNRLRDVIKWETVLKGAFSSVRVFRYNILLRL